MSERVWGRRPWLLVALAAALGSAVVRLALVLHAGGLTDASSTDDGVYFAAAASLVAGRLPYCDFLFLHPPGMLLALAPFAALGRMIGDASAFELARLAGILLGALNAGVVVLVLRRFGRAAALAGAAVYACSWAAVFAERSALLEPAGCFLLLAGFTLTSTEGGRRRTVLAGLVLGGAMLVKLTFVPPALIALVAMRRRAPLATAAAAAAVLVVCLPFLLADPAAMWHQLVPDQLGRRRIVPRLGLRLAGITLPPVIPGVPQRAALAAVLVLAVTLVVVGLLTPSARRYAVVVLVEFPLLLGSPSFYGHYAVLVVLPLALLAGVAVGRIRQGLRDGRRTVATLAAAAVLAVSVLGPWTPGRVARLSGPPLPTGLIAAVQGSTGCVTADAATTLILAGVLSRDLEHGCTVWPDVTGWQYDRVGPTPPGGPPWAARDPLYQRRVLAYLRSGHVVVLTRAKSGLSAATHATLTAGPAVWTGAYGSVHLIR